jgi:hypothetical protein
MGYSHMSAAAIIERVRVAGGHLRVADDMLHVSASAPLPDALIAELRAAKPELIELLAGPAERRRYKILTMFSANPALRLAVITDADSDQDSVIVTVGRRGTDGRGYTVDLAIDRNLYDGISLLELVEKYGEQPWPVEGGNA